MQIIIPLIMPCYRYLLDTAYIRITVIVVITVTKTLLLKSDRIILTVKFNAVGSALSLKERMLCSLIFYLADK